jgi:predicted ArsR family transcriptional regulator
VERLALLKALGDNTRYAIYLEIARSPSPRSTAEISETLGLHPNTVRPHLERMRDVGLLDVEIDARGTVGRPQHRYTVAADAPSLGLEPPAFPTLATMLAEVAAQSRPAADDVAEVGREQGRSAAQRRRSNAATAGALASTRAERCVSALVRELADLGFDPASDSDEAGTTMIAFTHCPYRELAETHPELVCHLHRGIVEGFVEQFADGPDDAFAEVEPSPLREYATPAVSLTVEQFHTLADRDPCQVLLTSRYATQ